MAQIKRTVAIILFSVSAIRIVEKESPDIIHLHSPMHFLVAWWARFRGIKSVLTYHGTDFNRVIGSRIYQLCLRPILNMNCIKSSSRTIVTGIPKCEGFAGVEWCGFGFGGRRNLQVKQIENNISGGYTAVA